MYVRPEEVAELVRTRDDAQKIIATLVQRFSTETAWGRVQNEARFAKQTTNETLRRVTSNLLTSFVTRKPDGYVVEP